MGAVQLAGDDVVEQRLPVGLGDDLDRQAFVLEEALFLGDDDGGTVGELDEKFVGMPHGRVTEDLTAIAVPL